MDINNIINEVVTEQLTKSMGQKLGISQGKAQGAVSMALPLLIGGLAKNAKNPKEAENILDALSKDHDGSILNDSSSVLFSENKQEEGGKIVDHILGSKTSAASKAIGGQIQIDPGQAREILVMLAPVVMGALGNKQKNGGFSSSTLSDFLQKTVKNTKTGSNQQDSLLTQILDQNKNGSVIDEIINFALKFFSGKSKKK